MRSRILAFSGCKQSGKSTCSNFVHGYQLRANDIIDGFSITSDGKLVVDTMMINHQGLQERAKAFLDVGRTDAEFAKWAVYSMWPYIKVYSFASPLKEIAVGLFGLSEKQAYGTDIDKNTNTHLRWENMPGVTTYCPQKPKVSHESLTEPLTCDFTSDGLVFHEAGPMTAREFMQYFGTDVCRKIHPNIWTDRLLKNIEEESPLIAIIDDCRFPNEADAIQSVGGKVVKLTRAPFKDSHSSESALDNYEKFDAVIDNSNATIHETNLKVIELLDEWGWLGKEVVKEELKPRPEQEPELVGGIHKFREEQ